MNELSRKEELDFCYLLTLLPALKEIECYQWLPELLSTIGHRSFIDLCKYAGGETITIPTLQELQEAITALEWYYKCFIDKTVDVKEVPQDSIEKVMKIWNIERNEKC